jgi:hypothetical protein
MRTEFSGTALAVFLGMAAGVLSFGQSVPQEAAGAEAPVEPEEEFPDLVLQDEPSVLVVCGSAWRAGERRNYAVLFDGVPIGQQSYMFTGAGVIKEFGKQKVLLYEFAHTLDMRFFGTAGRQSRHGKLITDAKGRPLYWGLVEGFSASGPYDVNSPLLEASVFQKTQIWFHAFSMKYMQSQKRSSEERREEVLEKVPSVILDDPLWGMLGFHFQYLEKGALSGTVNALVPLKRPRMDYFVPQNAFGQWKSEFRSVTWKAEKMPAGAKRVNVPDLGMTLEMDSKNRILRFQTGKGLELRLSTE